MNNNASAVAVGYRRSTSKPLPINIWEPERRCALRDPGGEASMRVVTAANAELISDSVSAWNIISLLEKGLKPLQGCRRTLTHGKTHAHTHKQTHTHAQTHAHARTHT